MDIRRARIIEKLQKLADPSMNSNVEERAAALGKLHELFSKETEGIILKTLLILGISPPHWRKGVFKAICRMEGCKGIYTEKANSYYLFQAAGQRLPLEKAKALFIWQEEELKRREIDAPTWAEKYLKEIESSSHFYKHEESYKKASLWVSLQRDNSSR